MTADAVGGVWRYCMDLIKGLVAQDVAQDAEVLLATMGQRPSEDQKRQVAAIPHVTLAESDYALEWMPKPWTDVQAAGHWLLTLARDFKPDVIHLNGYAHAVLPWARPVVVVAHSCVFSWWRAVHGSGPGPEWDQYKRRVLAGLAAASKVIAPSAAIARAIETEYGLAADSIQVIHNFSHSAAPERAQKEPFFLAAGRIWDEAKNIAMLERIAPQLKWELRISGGNDGRENAPSLVKSARFLGMLPYADVLDQMARASIFVHPALYEPFGLSVLEAAQRRCCLVLADIPSLRELWDGVAVFVDPRNPEQWVSELNSLSKAPEKRRWWGDRAYSHASRYSAHTAISEYEQLYRSLVPSRQRPGNGAAA